MHITTFILHIIEYLLYAYFAFAAVVNAIQALTLNF